MFVLSAKTGGEPPVSVRKRLGWFLKLLLLGESEKCGGNIWVKAHQQMKLAKMLRKKGFRETVLRNNAVWQWYAGGWPPWSFGRTACAI